MKLIFRLTTFILTATLLMAGSVYCLATESVVLGVTSPRQGTIPQVDFGAVGPASSPYFKPLAFQIVVNSATSWEMNIKASQDLTDSETGTSLPCSRLSWRLQSQEQVDSWMPLYRTAKAVTSGPPIAGQIIPFDLRLDVPWSDPPGNYKTEVVVSMTPDASLVLSSASPNPFSPNGDGTKDYTTVSFEAPVDGSYSGEIRSSDGELVSNFLGPTSLQTGWYTMDWDGLDSTGDRVSDGYYTFNILLQNEVVSAGTIVIDTIPPTLTLGSPSTEEVSSLTSISGSTEPESRVAISLNGLELTNLKSDVYGNFSTTIELPPGESILSVKSEDAAGNQSQITQTVVNNSAVSITSLANGQSLNAEEISISGLGPVSSEVTIYNNSKPVTTTSSDSHGAWTASYVPLTQGLNILSATAISATGSKVSSEEVSVKNGVPASGSAAISGTVRDASSLSPISAEVILTDANQKVKYGELSTDKTGLYQFTNLTLGTYALTFIAPNYKKETYLVELGAGETKILDVELEPNQSIQLTKEVSEETAETGEIVEYKLVIHNLLDKPLTDIFVLDYLPPGLKYIAGSTTLDGTPWRDPAISSTLTWQLDSLGANESAVVKYKTSVSTHETCTLINRASASAESPYGPVKSLLVKARLKIEPGIFGSSSTITGNVWADQDADGRYDISEVGIANVQIILEDGTTVSTDKNGRYSIPSVKPGLHILRINRAELSDYLVLNQDQIPIRVLPNSNLIRNFGLVPTETGKDVFSPSEVGLIYGVDKPLNLIALTDLQADKINDTIHLDGNLSLYLKGRIKEDTQLKLGINTEKTTENSVIESEEDYVICGDDSVIDQLPYAGPVYLALISDQLSAKYGRFSTDFMKGTFLDLNREIPGAVIKYDSGQSSLAAFDSYTNQVHLKEEFLANGTSGPFYLSNSPIEPNSEKVLVETRESTGYSLASSALERGVDYSIDYDSGRIELTTPLSSTDKDGNQKVLVVSYEYVPVFADFKHHLQGLHISTQPHPQLEIGVQHLTQNSDLDPLQLSSFYGQYRLSSQDEIRAEYGVNGNNATSGYELTGTISPLDGTKLTLTYTNTKEGFKSATTTSTEDSEEFVITSSSMIGDNLQLNGKYSASKGSNHHTTTGVHLAYAPFDWTELRAGYHKIIDNQSHDHKIHASLTKDFPWKELSTTVGAELTNHLKLSENTDAWSFSEYLLLESELTPKLSAASKLVFNQATSKSEADDNTLRTSLNYINNEDFSAYTSVQTSLSKNNDYSLALGSSYRPIPSLTFKSKFELQRPDNTRLMTLSASGEPNDKVSLNVRGTYEYQENSTNKLRLETSLVSRPDSRTSTYARLGVERSLNDEIENSIFGRFDIAYKLTNYSTLSTRYTYRRETSNGINVITNAFTFGVLQKLGESKWDIAGYLTHFTQDAQRYRLREYLMEVGHSFAKGLRIATGIKKTEVTGTGNPTDYKLYLNIGYGQFVGF